MESLFAFGVLDKIRLFKFQVQMGNQRPRNKASEYRIPLNKVVCCVLFRHLEFLVSRNERFCCFERREWSKLSELFVLFELFELSELLLTNW